MSPAPGVSASAGLFDASRIGLRLEPFVTVPGGPLAFAAPTDGSNRLFIAAQDGRAWVVRDGVLLQDPLVDLREKVRSGGEQGLLGIAVHPGFPNDPRIFVDYTDRNGDTVVASLEVDRTNPDRVDPATERRVLFVDQPFPNHNGGALAFGPDRYLYVSLGDGGSGGDPQGNGQNTNVLLGKILRIGIEGTDGAVAYAIPSDNPFAMGGGAGEVWLYGLRNPWRLSFDRETGDLWIGDVGQGKWEEIDVVRGGRSGLNLGWNRLEGTHCYPEGEDCDRTGMTAPVAEYGHDGGACTVIGGYVYRGSGSPALRGGYVFADYCSGALFAIPSTASEPTAPVQWGELGGSGTSAFGEDATGELYVANLDGRISRIVAVSK